MSLNKSFLLNNRCHWLNIYNSTQLKEFSDDVDGALQLS